MSNLSERRMHAIRMRPWALLWPMLIVEVSLLAAGCDSKKGTQTARQGEPFIVIDESSKTDFTDGSSVRHWTLSGQGIQRLSFHLKVFSDGEQQHEQEVVLGGADQDRGFHCQVSVLFASGDVFGCKGRLAVCLDAVGDEAFGQKTAITRDPVVIDTDRRPQGAEGLITAHQMLRSPGECVFLSREFAAEQWGETRPTPDGKGWMREGKEKSMWNTSAEWLEYSKDETTVVVVTLDWE